MLKALVPVDGSENADRAVRHVVKLVKDGEPIEIHLINVQPPFHGDVTTFVGKKTVDDYHREEAEKALVSARQILDEAGLKYKTHIAVGPAGETVCEFAKRLGVDKIVMGTRGHGKAVGLILGSVARDVIAKAPAPVTVVK